MLGGKRNEVLSGVETETFLHDQIPGDVIWFQDIKWRMIKESHPSSFHFTDTQALGRHKNISA